MKLGILKADSVRADWVPMHGEYIDMFRSLFHRSEPSLELLEWDTTKEELPSSPDQADAFLITGSSFSVYEDLKWIRSLEETIRELHLTQKKLVGICFGHQVIAQALGGTVHKAANGWGMGVHSYQVLEKTWASTEQTSIPLIASHQDQVMTLPAGARVTLQTDHCPIAGFALDDHIRTLQPHPEFTRAFMAEILTARRERIGDGPVNEAFTTLNATEPDGARAASWVLDFLLQER